MGSTIDCHPPLNDLFSIRDKTAICTGVTGGIGQELCLTLAQAGANIVSIQLVDDPNGPKLRAAVEALGRSFSAFECDICDSKALRETFGKIWRNEIQPDILLNCAGVNRRGKVEDLTDEDIDVVLGTNLKASYVAAQEFGRQLIALERPGKIVNIGSMLCFLGMYNVSAYAASKGGVLQMTKAFSNEWASKGIQVNCICPGYLKTPMTKKIVDDPEYSSYIMTRTPARRWGEPKDLRGALIFLASPASDFVTGTSIVVDGVFFSFSPYHLVDLENLNIMPTIMVAVFRGDPIDWAMYRHTAIHVRYADGEDHLLHVTGAHPFFEYTPQPEDPTNIGLKVEALIPVSSPGDSFTKEMIENSCAQTPVRNDPHNKDWNCQNWVGEALTGLVSIGCVTKEQRSTALGRMLDVCLEAEEE
ncbi:uncharacterized protein N7483_001167 [Penicillium malachiteum]|uniref:uncharacterized protein n=1 Tax=Penicillium malachiteum TaxID=1324776 RepID=UPI0025479A60|nr:uncharacterized protein N7483_001167 [Penicillium malachiteum]KAJ5736042.1 hypothetical protein N7483_001167 [Penicillium malachiteum]